MNFSSHSDGLRRPATGLLLVLALHLIVGWALVSGMATRLVEKVSVVVPVALIAEIAPPPPPTPAPPPPQIVRTPPRVAEVQKTVTAPPPTSPPVVQAAATDQASPAAITSTPTVAASPPSPAAEPAVVAPAPAVPLPPGKTTAQNMGVVCPKQVKPTMPRKAQQEGINGRVEALATVRGGRVVSVEIVSAQPRGVFESAVRLAMLQYRCEGPSDTDIRVPQEFNFSFEE